MALPVLILGFTLNYWVRTGLSDWLSYLLTDDRVRTAMMAASRSVLLITFLAAVASILLSFLLIYILTRPLLQLRQTAHNISRGKFDSRAHVWGKDEIGEVALSMNSMIDQLVNDSEALKRKNAQLNSINQIAMAASRDLDLPKVLEATLTGMLDVMGLRQGWIYKRDLDDLQVQLACWHGVEDENLDYKLLADNVKTCNCQNDLLSGSGLDRVAVRKCDRLSGGSEPGDTRTHISIPIQARGQKFGLINLACENEIEISKEDLDLLNAIGHQVSEIIANAWLHQRLVEKEAARQLLLHALVTAQDTERTRLARELHDEAGQTLTSLLMHLKALEKKTTEDELQAGLETVCNLASGAIERIREISYRFRPPALDEFGVEIALQTLFKEMTQDTNLRAQSHIDMAGAQIPMEMQISIYRIVQEALTNVLRHARATSVNLDLVCDTRNIEISIQDNGQGFDFRSVRKKETHKQLGLLGIQERVEILAGTFSVQSAPGTGTTLRINIPMTI